MATETPNFFAELWELAKTAGPFATCLLLLIWVKTDRERLRLQGERDALLERVLGSVQKMSDAMEATLALVKDKRRT